MAAVTDQQLSRLIDENALRRSAELYAQGADRRDKELWASLVTSDCVIEGPGFKLVGRAEIVASLDFLATTYVATQHRVHNQVVTIEGDTARGETYCTADHVIVSATDRSLLSWAIRYQDRWERAERQWRFMSRLLVLDWTETRALR
jgi:hypothetical protein